jgi:hypothetical protein
MLCTVAAASPVNNGPAANEGFGEYSAGYDE